MNDDQEELLPGKEPLFDTKELAVMDGPPPMLAMHIAEFEASTTPLWTKDEICEHFGITLHQLETYYTLPSFRADVRACIEELKNSHAHIRRKAGVQLETYVDILIPQWLADPDFPNAEKTKLLAFLAKTARVNDDPLEKAKAEQEAAKSAPQQTQPTLNLYLNTGDGNPPTLIVDQPKEKVIEHGEE